MDERGMERQTERWFWQEMKKTEVACLLCIGNCQNLQSVIVTHDAISLFIRFPIVEVVHLLEYATEYDMDVQVNINIYVVWIWWLKYFFWESSYVWFVIKEPTVNFQ